MKDTKGCTHGPMNNLTSGSSSAWLGIILIALGFLILFQQFGWFSVGRLLSLLWPSLLIYLGWKLYRQNQETRERMDGEVLSHAAVFSDFKLAGASAKLRSVKVWSLFGDGKVNVLEAQPAQGATLDVTLVFADRMVGVLTGWRVALNAVTLLSDLDIPSPPEGSPVDVPPTLRITGLSLFGDVKVVSRQATRHNRLQGLPASIDFQISN